MAISAGSRFPFTPSHVRRPPRGSLFWRVGLTNAAVLAAAVLSLAISPATVSAPIAPHEALILVIGAVGVILIDLVAVRRALHPVLQLSEEMGRVDLARPTGPVNVRANCAEVAQLTHAFDDMLERLESERRDSTRRILAAQEGERRRIAHELHDEIGQSVTFLLLQLQRAAQETDGGDALAEAQKTARATLSDLRRVAGQLRPESLDDLGLAKALTTLSERVADSSGLAVAAHVAADLAGLSPDTELAMYRVVQESLTNAVRHARATRVSIEVTRSDEVVAVTVRDDGDGVPAAPGGGMRGMRDRALSLGGSLHVGPSPQGGFEVCFEIPVGSS
jgi:two-component system, NarL family, sensor histidine kinase UhpB